jgi:hypothetical protein
MEERIRRSGGERVTTGVRREGRARGTRIELEIVRVIDTPEATHIRYRVRR